MMVLRTRKQQELNKKREEHRKALGIKLDKCVSRSQALGHAQH